MKYELILIIGSVFVILYACSNNVNRQNNKELSKISLLTKQIKSSSGEILKLNTFLYDSCLIKESSTIKNAVKKQRLLFIKNGVQISISDNPINNTVFTTTNCADSLKVLECVIYEIGFLKGNRGNLFCVKGIGLCNACPELFAFYNMSGECIWFNYSNQYKVFNSFGNFSEVCSHNGIDSTAWLNGKYKKVDIGL